MPFDSPHTISYQCFVPTISVSCTVNEILSLISQILKDVMARLAFDIFYLHIKFGVSRFSGSGNMIVGVEIEN